MKEQLLDDAAVTEVLEKHLSLKLMHFDHLTGAPTQVVSQLMLAAYVDNFDYFYQVSTEMEVLLVPLLILLYRQVFVVEVKHPLSFCSLAVLALSN